MKKKALLLAVVCIASLGILGITRAQGLSPSFPIGARKADF